MCCLFVSASAKDECVVQSAKGVMKQEDLDNVLWKDRNWWERQAYL